jgi:hypothetical protein
VKYFSGNFTLRISLLITAIPQLIQPKNKPLFTLLGDTTVQNNEIINIKLTKKPNRKEVAGKTPTSKSSQKTVASIAAKANHPLHSYNPPTGKTTATKVISKIATGAEARPMRTAIIFAAKPPPLRPICQTTVASKPPSQMPIDSGKTTLCQRARISKRYTHK